MRVSRVYTNETCNHNCAFCNRRRGQERRGFVAEAVARIGRASADGGELVLTGGEPSMRTDLPQLIKRAKEGGAARVTLESNGALIDEALARKLKEAGLDRVRIHLPGWGERLDQVTRDRGSFVRTLAAAQWLSAEKIEIEASFPVVQSTQDQAASLPEDLAATGLPWAAIVGGVPTDAPDPKELLELTDAAQAIGELADAARRVSIPVRMESSAVFRCVWCPNHWPIFPNYRTRHPTWIAVRWSMWLPVVSVSCPDGALACVGATMSCTGTRNWCPFDSVSPRGPTELLRSGGSC